VARAILSEHRNIAHSAGAATRTVGNDRIDVETDSPALTGPALAHHQSFHARWPKQYSAFIGPPVSTSAFVQAGPVIFRNPESDTTRTRLRMGVPHAGV
jgi:hypothetical protein